MRYIIGVDPGLDGAFVMIRDGHPSLLASNPFSMPTIKTTKGKSKKRDYDIIRLVALAETLHLGIEEEITWVIEDVHAFPGQGVTGTFNFGRGKGLLEMLPYTVKNSVVRYISPQRWKGHFGLLKTEKEAAIELASKRGLKTKRSGEADAFLIALAYYEIYMK